MIINSISPINYSFKANKKLNEALTNSVIQSDTFERTEYKVQAENPAINWLENSNFIKQELCKILSDSNNKIGQGFHHCVYSR